MKFIKDNSTRFNYGYSGPITCKRASKDKHYIKVLAACRDKHMTMKEIYPSIKHPLTYEVASLCRLGLLQRYGTPKYMKEYEFTDGTIDVYPTRFWYKTTAKGRKLLAKVGL